MQSSIKKIIITAPTGLPKTYETQRKNEYGSAALHDNALVHTVAISIAAVRECGFSKLAHPIAQTPHSEIASS